MICDIWEEECEHRFQVTRVPSAVFFHGDAFVKYEGGMHIPDLLSWKETIKNPELNWQSLEDPTQLESLRSELESLSPVVVYFGYAVDDVDWSLTDKNFELFSEWTPVLDTVSPYMIEPETNAEVLKGLGIDDKIHMNQILLLMAWGPKILHLKDVKFPADINDAVNANRSPPLDIFTEKYLAEFYKRRKGIFVLVSASYINDDLYAKRAMYAACYKLKQTHEDLKIALIHDLVWPSTELDMFEDVFGMVNYKDPNVFILKNKEEETGDYGLSWHKYRLDEPPTSSAVTAFVQRFYKGALKGYLKSSSPPTINQGNLKIVVQKTFDQFTKDKRRSCVLVFYSSNPRYCYEDYCGKALVMMEKLAAEYNELGREDIWFSKMNGVTDEIIDFEIDVLPTIVGFKAGTGGEPIGYEGDLKSEEIKEWVGSNFPETVSEDFDDFNFEGDL